MKYLFILLLLTGGIANAQQAGELYPADNGSAYLPLKYPITSGDGLAVQADYARINIINDTAVIDLPNGVNYIKIGGKTYKVNISLEEVHEQPKGPTFPNYNNIYYDAPKLSITPTGVLTIPPKDEFKQIK